MLGAGAGRSSLISACNAGKSVERHHGEHVVLDVIVHVPIDEPAQRIHVDRAAVEPMVGDVVGKTAVLGQARHDVMPGAIHPRQPDDHRRQDAARHDASHGNAGVDHEPHTGGPVRPRPLGVGHEGCLFRQQSARGMDDHVLERLRHGEQTEEISGDVPQRGGRLATISGS